MRDFTPASGIVVNEYLASTSDVIFDSASLSQTGAQTDSLSKQYLQKGTVLARITSPATASGLVGPFDPAATDGRQLIYGIVGINDTFADLSNGPVDIGVLVVGRVKTSNVIVAGVKGGIADIYKTAMQNNSIHILFQ